MRELKCRLCENPIATVAEGCPKCGGNEATRQDGKRYLEVDVAHAGETMEKALAKLNQAASEALAGAYQGLRVVHGYGSGSHHTKRIKEAVQAKLLSYREKYHGTVSQGQNPGLTVWKFLKGK